MMHPIIKKYIEFNNFGRDLGLHFDIIEPGLVKHTMTVTERHLATPFTAHGGATAAMMDAVLGVAALSLSCLDFKIVSTVEFKINYLNPALLGDELSGESIIEQKGNRIIIVSGTIKSVNRDKVIAKCLSVTVIVCFTKPGSIISKCKPKSLPKLYGNHQTQCPGGFGTCFCYFICIVIF